MITRDDPGIELNNEPPEHSAGYRELLRHPGVVAIAVYSALGRLPLGMTSVLLVLLLHGATGSYVLAGTVVAVNSLAFATAAPLFGRLADRGHRRAVLVVVGVLQPVTMVLLVVAVNASAPIALVLACTALAGALYPPVSAITRERWTAVLPAHLHHAAFGMEALLTEGLYIIGPLIATIAVLFAGPDVGLIASSICVAVGCLLLVTTPALRTPHGVAAHTGEVATAPPAARTRLLTPRVVAIVAVAFGLGMAFGQLEIAIPAFGVERGSPAMGPVLMAIWSIASVVGGILFLRLRRPRTLETRLLLLVVVNVAGLALFGVATSEWWLGALLIAQGLFMAPAVAAEFSVTSQVAPPSRTTEAFTWLNTGAYVGGAFGSALGGFLIGAAGIPIALSSSAILGLVAVGAALYLRYARSSPSVSTDSNL